jgi:hypothetical protein
MQFGNQFEKNCCRVTEKLTRITWGKTVVAGQRLKPAVCQWSTWQFMRQSRNQIIPN